MKTDSSDAASPKRFGSLVALQDHHASLVRDAGANVLEPASLELVTAFVRRAAATGALLDQKDDRAAAQGLINFWSARLRASARKAERLAEDAAPTASRAGAGLTDDSGLRSAGLSFEDTLLADFDPKIVDAVQEKADAWLAGLTLEQRVIARRVLLRLVRLLADDSRFDPVPTVKAALYDLDTPENVNAVVSGLVDAGVVRVTRAESTELDRLTLRFPALANRWGVFQTWLDARRRFRGAVKDWAKGGRPEDALATGEALDEAKSYFDRDGLEREYLEHARRRDWRKNKINKVLKWVFGGLALVALVGWVAAGIGLRWANQEAGVANEEKWQADEARRLAVEARAALEKKQVTLTGRHQLTNLRLLVRGIGELTSAHTQREREIAQTRWRALVEQLKEDAAAATLRDKLKLDQLGACAVCGENTLTDEDIRRIRRMRSPMIENDELHKALKATRKVAFTMVRESATKAVELLRAKRPFTQVEPFAAEFWTQYWGEMLLVEGKAVESEMILFGQALRAVWEAAEKPDSAKDLSVEAGLRGLVTKYGAKGKALASKFQGDQLNATTFSQLETGAKELNLDKADLAKLQDSLYQLREKALSRPVSSDELIDKLAKALKPLLAALDKEEAGPIPEYDEAEKR